MASPGKLLTTQRTKYQRLASPKTNNHNHNHNQSDKTKKPAKPINGAFYEEEEEGTTMTYGTDPKIHKRAERLSMKASKHERDFVWGVRALWITNLVWGILHMCGFLILLIYRLVIVAQGTTKILTVFLITTFSIFNSDPVDHPNVFYPVIWPTSNYLIDIPFLVVLSVAAVMCLVKAFAAMMKSDAEEDADSSEYQMYGEDELGEDRTYGYGHASRIRNFYIKSVHEGQFWFRWVEWFIDGGALLWGVMTISPIQDSILLVTLLMVYAGIMSMGFMHEWTNRIKLTNVQLKDPIIAVDGGRHIRINRKPRNWSAFLIGLILNSWIFVVIFLYYGYADNFNPGAYQWYRLAIAPIAAGFYLLVIPLVILVWTVTRPTSYEEIKHMTMTTDINDGEPQLDDDLKEHVQIKSQDERHYWDMTEGLRAKVHDFMYYQDWNKNVIYEITMTSVAGLCKHTIIWILWGGMLSA